MKMTILHFSPGNALAFFLWVFLIFGFFLLSLYRGLPLQDIQNSIVFIAYLIGVVMFGATEGDISRLQHPSKSNPSPFSPNSFLMIFIILWMLFFLFGFQTTMNDYKEAKGSAHSSKQQLVHASMVGWKISYLLYLVPFATGYLPVKAIRLLRKRNNVYGTRVLR